MEALGPVCTAVHIRCRWKSVVKSNYVLGLACLACLSVWMLGTAHFPPDAFLCNFTYVIFTQICQYIPILVKIRKTGTLHEDLCSFIQLVFIMETDCVLCEVKSEAKEIVNLTISTEAGCVLCVVQGGQRNSLQSKQNKWVWWTLTCYWGTQKIASNNNTANVPEVLCLWTFLMLFNLNTTTC